MKLWEWVVSFFVGLLAIGVVASLLALIVWLMTRFGVPILVTGIIVFLLWATTMIVHAELYD